MELNNKLKLLFITTLHLIFTIHAARLAPEASPGSELEPSDLDSELPFFTQSPSPSPGPSQSSSEEQPFISYLDFFPDGADESLLESASSESSQDNDPLGLDTILKAIPGKALNPLVKTICDKTDHADLCMTQVGSITGKVDLQSVLETAVKTAGDFSKQALNEVKKITATSTSPMVKSRGKDCEDGFESVVENYDKAKEALASNDIGTISSQLSASITFIDDCETEFRDSNTPSPFKPFASKLTNMTSNVLAITQQIPN